MDYKSKKDEQINKIIENILSFDNKLIVLGPKPLISSKSILIPLYTFFTIISKKS